MHLRLLLFLLLFCCSEIDGLRAADQTAGLLANSQKEVETLRAAIVQKRDLVAKAVTEAMKAGRIKPSTAAFYQDALDKFVPGEGLLPEFERLYFPPKFDTSEEMEPINFAWTALREEVQRASARVAELNTQFANAASDALQQAGRSAEKPEELDELDRLFSAWAKLPEVTTRSSMSRGPRDSLQRLAGVVRAVLSAMQANDPAGAAAAFNRLNANSMNMMDIRSGNLPIRVDTFLEDFRARITTPLLKQVTEAQREVEKGIMEERPHDDVEKALTAFQKGTAMLDRIRNAARNNSYTPFTEQNQMVSQYRASLALVESMKVETEGENYPSVPQFPSDTTYPIGPEFRTYLLKLTAKLAAHRRESSARLEKRREEEQRVRAAEVEKARRDATTQMMKTYRARIAAVKTPEDLLALADELGVANSGDERSGFPQLSLELRSVAGWWLDGSPPARGNPEAAYADPYGRSHQFVGEMHALRGRVLREIAAKRLKLPQILEPPFREMDAREALQKVAEETATRGDWKKVNEILEMLAQWTAPAAGPERERLLAIRNYLIAQNLESAGQHQQAALAYLAVIRAVGDALPTKEAAEHLKRIQSEHPETQKLLLTPPAGAGVEQPPAQ
jgi:hypothetical protein